MRECLFNVHVVLGTLPWEQKQIECALNRKDNFDILYTIIITVIFNDNLSLSQKLLAIGNREGTVRILGRPGIDLEIQHESRAAAQVMQMEFVHNAGQLVTACTDDSLNLWDFRKANSPELVQSMQLSKEHITTFCLEFQVRSAT